MWTNRADSLLAVAGAANDLSGSLLPRKCGDINDGLEVLLVIVGQEAKVNQSPDELGETLVTKGASDDGVGFRNAVAHLVRGGVAVGVANEGETRVDVVWLGGAHELGTSNVDNLAILVDLGGVPESEKNTAAGPRELVAERVATVLGGGQTTAVAEEAVDGTTGLVDLVNGLDGVKVINTGVKTDLVHDSDAGVLGSLIELQHSGGDV